MRAAADQQLQGPCLHRDHAARHRHAPGDRLVADIDHARLAAVVEMRELV
jgi:hypothetical protein